MHQEILKSLKGLDGLENQEITLTPDQLDLNYKLFNLKNCKIKMQGNINMLFIRNIQDCEIVGCPVSNSIMIHDTKNTSMSIIGHQVIFLFICLD